MVTNRSGRWYIEEKLDEGAYVDTSSVLLSNEDKKWATYDNIENNIALDCYSEYSNKIKESCSIFENRLVVNNPQTDLSDYVGQTLLLEQSNNKKEIKLVRLNSVVKETVNMHIMRTNKTPYKTVYIRADTVPGMPNISVYDENGKYLTFGILNDSGALLAYEDGGYKTYVGNGYTDLNLTVGYAVSIEYSRGNSISFDIIYPEFDSFSTELPEGTEIGVVSQGRYLGEFIVPDNGVIQLPFEVHKIIYGATYLARGIIKIQQPYESMKQVQQVAVSVLNTGHLEVGTSLNDMVELEKIKDDSHLDLTTITMNGSYVIVPSDTPEWEKNIIFQSRKGLPFTVNCIEAIINYSNMGGK
jgi:hypothetical protein